MKPAQLMAAIRTEEGQAVNLEIAIKIYVEQANRRNDPLTIESSVSSVYPPTMDFIACEIWA